MKSVLAVAFALLAAVAVCDGECPKIPDCPAELGEFPELYAVPSNCSQYVLCGHNGVATIKDCPGELHFNPELKVCDYQENVKCKPCKE